MELDMVLVMLRNFWIYGYEVNVFYGDSDLIIMVRLKLEFKELKKRNDKNYFKKNFLKEFYKFFQIYKELKIVGVILYLICCYMYFIFSKCVIVEEFVNKLEVIVFYLYGDYSYCYLVEWCIYYKLLLIYRLDYLYFMNKILKKLCFINKILLRCIFI